MSELSCSQQSISQAATERESLELGRGGGRFGGEHCHELLDLALLLDRPAVPGVADQLLLDGLLTAAASPDPDQVVDRHVDQVQFSGRDRLIGVVPLVEQRAQPDGILAGQGEGLDL